MFPAGLARCGLGLLLAATALLPSPAPAQATQRPTFRAGVDLVQLDVVVTDRQGRPVRGLTREDFEVLEDGRAVEIGTFEAIDLPDREDLPPTRLPDRSGGVTASNEDALDGRLVVIVLDAFDPSKFHRVRKIVLAVLDQLGPTDQVAMLSIVGNRKYQVEFTTERERVARALDRPSLAHPSAMPGQVLDVLRKVTNALEPVTGRRKVVALISEGVPEIVGSMEIGGHNFLGDLQHVLSGAARSHVTVYAFSPAYAFALDSMVDAMSPDHRTAQVVYQRDGELGLQTIAELTGGRALVRSNIFDRAVERMFDETGSYYLLGYYSPVPPDGRFRRITVRVGRDGLSLRTRSGYTAAPAGGLLPGESPAPLDRLLAAPVHTYGLDLRVAATPLPLSTRGRSAVLVVAETRAAQVSGAPGVEVKMLAVDMQGRVRATQTLSTTIAELLPVDGTRWTSLASEIEVRPGRYQLRVAARRIDNVSQGSVFLELEVPDFGGELAVGGLVLGTPWRNTPVAPHARAFPVLPMTTAEILADMPVAAALPLRIGSRHRHEPVRLLATLLPANGPPREILRREGPASGFAAAGVVELPLPASLEPGDYTLRVEVRVGRASASREKSFRVFAAATTTG